MPAETVDLGKCLVVSPHLDDAVFACGDLIRAHPGTGVLTVMAGRPPRGFPLTRWDADCGFRAGDDIMGTRREEDRAALRLLGARPFWLDFLDSQYRNSPSAGEVRTALEEAVDDFRPASVVFPFGLFHSDHRLVHEAALSLADRRPDIAWHLYEDALYRALEGFVLGRSLKLMADGFALERLPSGGPASPLKREAAARYRSQIRALSKPGYPGCEDAFRPERIWRLRAPVFREPAAPAAEAAR